MVIPEHLLNLFVFFSEVNVNVVPSCYNGDKVD